MGQQKTPPVHPGEILLEDFMKPMEITHYRHSASEQEPALLASSHDC